MGRRALGVLFLVAAFAASFAQFGPHDKLNFLHSFRGAVPVRHLHPFVKVTYWFYSAPEWFDKDGHQQDVGSTYSQSWFLSSFAFGAGDVAEFGVCVPFVTERTEPDYGSALQGSGVGDMWLWAKTAVTQKPWFGFRFAVKLPTGEDEPPGGDMPTGTGQTDFDMGLQLSEYPEKMGFVCDVNASYRIRLPRKVLGLDYDPGDGGHLGVYIGGIPVEGFGVLFGVDGFAYRNDRIEGEEITKSYRISSMLGAKMFFRTRFGLKLEGMFKIDVAGKDVPAGVGLAFDASYEPQF